MPIAKPKYDKSGLDWCRKFSLRPTKTRQLLFGVLSRARGPQSVPQLQATFASQGYVPNKTTLYREVEQLVIQGILTKVQLAETRVSYEMAEDHHHHFVCQQCQQVTKLSFCESVMAQVSRALERQGKQVQKHTFEFFGICELCK